MSDRIREIQKFVDHLYELTGTANWAEVEKFLTEDFFVTEADTLPYAGVYRGKGALRELYGKVMSMMDVVDLKIHETTVGHDYAVTLLDMVLAGNPPAVTPHEKEIYERMKKEFKFDARAGWP